MGVITKVPKLGCFQTTGCAPMARSFQQGLEVAENVLDPSTGITNLTTGVPGEAYRVLRKLILEHGGTIDAVDDADAFEALRTVARLDGISVEPAAAVSFAGLVKLVAEGTIRGNESVVVNCSGHTLPVEKHIVGDDYVRNMVPGDD